MPPTTDQLLTLPAMFDQVVPPEHIDVNGHMNISHYFGEGSWAVWRLMFEGEPGGEHVVEEDYLDQRGLSFFTVEHRIAYLGELREGQRYSVHAGIVGHTAKAVHGVAFVVDRESDRLACRMEIVYVHVSIGERRSVPMPDDVVAGLVALEQAHPWLPEVATGLSLR